LVCEKANPDTTTEDFHREADVGKKGLAAWLMEIGWETAPLMNDGRTSRELMDELYDVETGLPK
jgi:hypothetical protein